MGFKSGSFLKDQAAKEAAGLIFFGEVDHEFAKGDELRRQKFSWREGIYPSSLRFSMCPHKYVTETVHKPLYFKQETLFNMEIGKAIHKILQKKAIKRPYLLWKDINIPEELLEKYKDIYPEVPIKDVEKGISGYIDLALSIKRKPVIADIKTKYMDPEEWPKFKQKSLPTAENLCQVCIYAELANRQNYFGMPVETVAVFYFNVPSVYDKKQNYGKVEYYVPYSDDLREKTSVLIEHLGLERFRVLNKIESECSYPLCFTHSRGKKDETDRQNLDCNDSNAGEPE